ncbi:regulatory iron-sulfur-containing complex subunit RicT [Bacteroides sp.]|uniref:PSP1 domain-containing protein n=1 Tax=Bacteroides sp. TaxID=29523 RepID=UPI002637DC98|nr:regulatory iron-sulfur-containing complex subunit RicT [Bacteroides sp.]MDD3039336.1 regulatory iron-sulfur-containing complex subunit RicT [Bacteroides sp.]
MEFKLHNGSGGLCCKGCSRQDNKLNTYDWLADIPGNAEECDMVEVQFKNTRKGYYRNSNKIKLEKGDVVAVEAAPGHDIGVVTLTGRLVPLQMKKANFKADTEIKRIYRKAKPVDMEKFNEAKAKEHTTMIRARQIALSLNLNMKIGDVEYQGDGNKAIFYYIADERVDFRQLIKVLAEAFRVRIEMKQIGARQEAGRIGGIGPCGRELCCATWMTSFVSVSTSAARYQDISLNPQKLAGQCAKLKCCLNYEVDCYVEAQKRLPSKEIELETKDGIFYFFKADILSNQISYSTDRNFPANLVTISGKRAFEVIAMNKKGMKPDSLLEAENKQEPKKPIDLLEQESLTRFDRSKIKDGNNISNRNKKKKKGNNNRPQQQVEGVNRPQQPSRENENRPQVVENENTNRGDKDNRPRNNNRNKGQNQGRNNENGRPERVQNPERQQNLNSERQPSPERGQQRPQRQERPQIQERPQGQERQSDQDRSPRPERNRNQEKPQNNEKPVQE